MEILKISIDVLLEYLEQVMYSYFSSRINDWCYFKFYMPQPSNNIKNAD